jgi:hypothetical protein
VLRPKSFAGLFAAAPSVALATITLTVIRKGPAYAAVEARSMIFGSAAFLIYAVIVSRTLFRTNHEVLGTTAVTLIAWFGITFAIEALL